MGWFTRTYRVFFHTSICVPVGKKTSAMLLCFAVRDIAALFLRCCCPPAATTTASTLRTTAAALSHSLASFNYQAFLMDPLSRSPAKRSKTAEVVDNIISCERNFFPETHLCNLCVISRSRVLRSV